MLNFTYHNPTTIIFGKNQISELKNLIPQNKNILLTAGQGSIKKNTVYNQVMAALQSHNITEFWGIEPNPTYEMLMKAVDLVKEKKIDFLLSVGGGSVLDGTKFIAAATLFGGENPWDILANRTPVQKALPLASVLTIPATGSESNGNAVISRIATKEKKVFVSNLVRPQFSILDPEATYTLPKNQIANGIADAFVHVLEQYLTYPVNAPLQDRQAEAVLKTLVEIAPALINHEPDYDTRATFMWCANQALNGLLSCGVPGDWATHIIGHELTALYGLAHAEALTVVCPRLLSHQKENKKEKLIQYGQRIWNSNDPIEKTESFFRSLGLKTNLSEYNVPAEKAAKIIEQRFKLKGFHLGEHANITPHMIKEIILAC